jgi:cobalt-zinc-cadmium efflux system protein
VHDHHAHDARSANSRRLAITLALTASYMLAEVVGGLLSGSLALLADAGHMLSDTVALALSMFAIWIAARPATSQQTYGYYRMEILAALVNGAALLVIAALILREAWTRILSPTEVHAPLMLAIAAGGLVMNLVGLGLLRHGKETSLNMRGAWLHVLTDALGSVAAIVSAIVIWTLGWRWADPAASALIALFVMYSAWSLLGETVAVLMEGAPGHIDVDDVRNTMASVTAVRDVHDLHVWTITSGRESLSAHVVVAPESDAQGLLAEMRELLRARFGIDHVTIQIESPAHEECGVCV